MIINKFSGKTKEEAIEKAKIEMGEDAVIMNVKTIKPSGLFSVFQSEKYEVTAAIEEKEAATPISAFQSPLKKHEQINLTADEPIVVPPIERTPQPEAKKSEIEERLDNIQNMIENRFQAKPADIQPPVAAKPVSQEAPKEAAEVQEPKNDAKSRAESFQFIKVLYKTLLDNDVNERYANLILDELDGIMKAGNSVDYILQNVYQKIILKFGQPKPIDLSGKKPKVIFAIGPTGVGKTTTIAKIASKFKVEQGKKVAFLTADTYRIAATEQLKTYANILEEPFSIIYSPEELNQAVEKVSNYDLVVVDTAGFSHKSEGQREDIKQLIDALDPKYDKSVFLVLSATTKYKDLLEIIDIYNEIAEYKIIFTKLDETSTYGNLLNVKLYSDAELSYITNGQNVPDDIEVFDTQKIVKRLLGGK